MLRRVGARGCETRILVGWMACVCAALLALGLAHAAVARTPLRSRALASAQGLTGLVVPPDGESYFGFTYRLWDSSNPGWGDTRPFSQRIADSIQNELGGKTPTFLTVWAPWQLPDEPGKPMEPFSYAANDIKTVQRVTGADSLLYLDWNLISTTSQNGGITVKDVASGRLDHYIRDYAIAIKSYAKPVLVRLFGGEFNGSWSYGQSPRTNPALAPSDFVAAWRRVVDIFRQVGALNASWAWTPNVYPPKPVPYIDPHITAYYPGNDYVDWAGADAYDYEPVSDLGSLYDFAVAHAKPFFLAEWGIRHDASTLTPTDQRDWIAAMFDFFEGHLDVKAINYFNEDYRLGQGQPLDPSKLVYLDNGQVNYQADTNDGDTRLLADSGAGFGATFASRISAPRYLSTTLTQPLGPTTTRVIVKARVQLIARPRIQGIPRVGHTLHIVRGIWRSAAAFSYRWLRGGTPIPGATKPTYRLRTIEAGKTIACRVTAHGVSSTLSATTKALGIGRTTPQTR